jgi:hypothetical protein
MELARHLAAAVWFVAYYEEAAIKKAQDGLPADRTKRLIESMAKEIADDLQLWLWRNRPADEEPDPAWPGLTGYPYPPDLGEAGA